jgi:small conductance mechanosensitive channel
MSALMEALGKTDLQEMSKILSGFLVEYSFQILGALFILLAGWFFASYVSRLALRFLEKKKVDVLLARFLAAGVRYLLLALVVLMVITKLGVRIDPLIAAIGAGAFGLSLALQAPISNYGSGLAIILTRPFTIGNTITVQGFTGMVDEVTLGFTRLVTEDHEIVTIPNRHIVGEVIVNSRDVRVVEGVIGVAYETDMDLAIKVVLDAILSDPDVARAPAPQVGIEAFGDSSVNIGYRFWVPSKSYYSDRYEANELIFKAIRRHAITIPFPQMELNVKALPGR